ncbi:nitrate ABC transporter substrate-binding protein [Thermosipho melanesiensis]|uniref:ABC-type nitrate/sulfonate/bicarbonate transport systems periplasmic components-like protein n=2 Tax=Thermosipho melanesiensis TaxID=46541 RepID=A6LLD8_THEM4|nr:ABC transporter substrate-binding protein [Thermosipho melanesiensis]ABR30739.1 ABC-type nitrate/sulfonate/bicarbonate transport systems periplasmic components-like protein [Thermosipho melanesiensis BI429]APT73865.1 nitrate ABC transporter substrate-binding protein [Thermosipho melanesiensis]OOC36763.1 nitrate ABC transporter substrate-binding protein [Thermosipho melanesiensis]OOC38464.1 nitrate ABC transporter substrate-binding protein [Thermosipho melanesiensis]OOC38926.1 nitrate ABC tr
MKKITLILLLFSVIHFSLTLLNPFGPTIFPVAPIIGEKVKGDVDISVEFWKNLDDVIAKVATSYAKFVVLPITTAANLYAKGVDIKLIGVHEWKVFYLVANTEYTDLTSLKGQTVYSAHGRGQTVDVLLRYLLTKEGLKPDVDVKFAYAPPQEIVALFKSGKIHFAALPEPFVTMCLGNGKIVLDFQNVWNNISGSKFGIPIAGLFVIGNISNYKNTINEVENIFKSSVEYANSHIDESLAITSKYFPIPVPVLKKSLERTEFKYIKNCKEEVDLFLRTMHKLYEEGIPKVPDEGFYLK